MKKLLVIGGAVVVIFALIVFLSNKSDEAKLKDNPYGTNDLDKLTIGLIGNEDYKNITLPDEVEKKVQSGDPTTVYFFSPKCNFCMETTPVLMPVADDMNVHVNQFNVLEFEDEAKVKYDVVRWPVVVQFENGEEVARIEGAQPKENFEKFFQQYAVK